MKRWTGGVVIVCLTLILIVSYSFIGKSQPSKKQQQQSVYDFFNPHPPQVEDIIISDPPRNDGPIWPKPKFRTLQGLDELYSLSESISAQDSSALLAWAQMKVLFPRSDALPETAQGIQEAVTMCKQLLLMIPNNKPALQLGVRDATPCPRFLTAPNATTLLHIPCGLVEDSSVTLIGIPDSRLDTFQIELMGSQIEEGLNPPIVLQYKVLLPGHNFTKQPVTIQNSWAPQSGWGKEEKCPHHDSPHLLKVDGLVKCNTQVIRGTTEGSLNTSHPANRKLSNVSEGGNHESTTFHFVEGNPFTATLWAGNEGFHMTVNGRHETSYAYRERLEPWLVNSVNVKGGLTTVSILAKGLPVTEDVVDGAQLLKAPPLSNKKLLLFIGVFSSGNNFERRMALRRTWMQYDAVRSGDVAVRFFIGLHKNKEVNFKLWREAQAYEDIQLMPFVDYYSLLTYKTIAICILGTKALPARYIMKMDDDAFVRIDEVLSILKAKKTSDGLLYGHISFESAPHRDKDNKWFISEEEWPHSSFPPWAHGPGYILSEDIARFIVKGHQDMELMLFKLEDVAVGIWVEQYKEKGCRVEYVNDNNFYNAGCEADYVLAHYQNPRMMLCLWDNLLKHHKPQCCD